MTLHEAIEQSQNEYDAEVGSFEVDRSADRIAKSILEYEYGVLDKLDLFGEITRHAPIAPAESRLKIYRWVTLAFRLGMRVERKLQHPDKPTSIFDVSYERPEGKWKRKS